MLSGLKEGQEKMSKSDPDSAIFMEDSAEDVRRKIKKAFCPPGVVEKNPILDYSNHIIFGYYGKIEVQTSDVKICLSFCKLIFLMLYIVITNTRV